MKIKNTMTKGDAPVERSYFSNPSFFAAIMMILFLTPFLSACSSQKSQYQEKRYLIVIDPGYGARNSDEVALKGKIDESTMNLIKAKRLAQHINRHPKFRALLTRNDDAYIPMDERGAFPNRHNADIFISVQTILDEKQKDYEIGTYCLGTISDEKALRTAVKTNLTTSRNIHDLEAIINDLFDEEMNRKSCELACQLQEGIIRKLKDNVRIGIKNEGTRKTPLYVFLGAKMPSVLIETSHFGDGMNDNGNKRMSNWDYVCKGLLDGIELYMDKNMNPAS